MSRLAAREDSDSLGAPLAIRRGPDFLLLAQFLLCGFGFLLCLVPVVFAGIVIVAGLYKAKASDFVASLLILGIFGSLVFLAGKMMRRAWRGMGVRLLVFPEGIVYRRWRRVVVYRWKDVGAFTYWSMDQMERDKQNPDDFHLVNTIYYFRFRHRDGHRFLFSETLDRFAKQPIVQLVEKGLLNYRLPLLRERLLQQYEEIPFGPFAIGPEGLVYKRALLPWSEVDFVWAEDGKVQVRKNSKVLNWCSEEIRRVPNCCLLLALAKERVDAKDVSRRKAPAVRNLDAVEEKIVGGFAAKVLGFKLFGFNWKVFFASLIGVIVMGYIKSIDWLTRTLDPHELIPAILSVLFVILVRIVVALIWVLRGDRLILRKDYFQRATKEGEVVSQIPYRNIARIELVGKLGRETYIGIKLKDADDSATFNAVGRSIQNNSGRHFLQRLRQFLMVKIIKSESAKSKSGWHYWIADEWSMPLQQIYERLQKRLSS